MSMQQSCFTENTFAFLRGLDENNTKAWFEAHRSDYESYLLNPFKCLAESLQPVITAIDPLLENAPQVNRAISRIHRDIRFSKDKRPYRTSMWLGYKLVTEEGWQAHPAFFFEIMPHSYRYGMGFYTTEASTMETMRHEIRHNDRRFNAMLQWYAGQAEFVLDGDLYKRLKDVPDDPERAFWYVRKNIYLVHNGDIDDRFFSTDWTDTLTQGFHALRPAYEYFSHISEREQSDLKPIL